jgi:hypothetical protein
MRRILAVALAAAAMSLVPATAQAATCGGLVDVNCYGTTCPTDCFSGDCTVWVNALKNPMTALCVG